MKNELVYLGFISFIILINSTLAQEENHESEETDSKEDADLSDLLNENITSLLHGSNHRNGKQLCKY